MKNLREEILSPKQLGEKIANDVFEKNKHILLGKEKAKDVREEIKEILFNFEFEVPLGDDIDVQRLGGNILNMNEINELADKILALAPFATVERVRELSRGLTLKAISNSVSGDELIQAVCDFEENIKALNQPEEFDVKGWLSENKFKSNKFNDSIYENGVYGLRFYNHTEDLEKGCMVIRRNGNNLFDGKIPTSKPFFLQLLDALGVEV